MQQRQKKHHTIKISQKNLNKLRQHAISATKRESCALLLGEKNHIKEIFVTDNADEHPEKFFTIPDAQLIESYKTAEKHELEVVGIFHSHPGSKAIPSETDKKYMRVNPVVWVIYSGIDDEFFAYKIADISNSANELENVDIGLA